MPIRNVLRSDIIEILNFYLDSVRSKDVSNWHFDFALVLTFGEAREKDRFNDKCRYILICIHFQKLFSGAKFDQRTIQKL